MNLGSSFGRKIAYAVAIALLLYPLFRLGQPASVDADGNRRAGGLLAQMRYDNQLSQANLGDIDPASESMRLATLGLRGVAANVLWTQANHYKKVQDYHKLSATLIQLTKVQPNYIKVWEFQAHNLSYNVSVEFDNYQHRYHWVKRGINFLMDGKRYNSSEPKMLNHLGWFTGQKIGRSDEKRQFRRMFRTDDEFHTEMNAHINVLNNRLVRGPDGSPDNWLVGRLWYLQGESLVDDQGVSLRGTSPLIFFKHAPMSQMNFAASIEEEGNFSDFTRNAWSRAGKLWGRGIEQEGIVGFGRREIPTTWGMSVRLLDTDEASTQIKELRAELDTLAPGYREKLQKEREASLTPDEKEAFTTSPENWTRDLSAAFATAQQKTLVTEDEIAAKAPPESQRKAKRIAKEIAEKTVYIQRVHHYQNTVAYKYWLDRADLEQTSDMTRARELVYNAKKALDAAKLEEAKTLYDESWGLWAKIFEQFDIVEEDTAKEDLQKHIQSYTALLRQMDEEFPRDFPLKFLIGGAGFSAPSSPDGLGRQRLTRPGSGNEDAKPEDAKPEDAKPEDAKPEDAKPEDAKPAEAKPAEDKPMEPKPAEAKPAEAKPTEAKAADKKPMEPKPAEPKAADKPAEAAKKDTDASDDN